MVCFRNHPLRNTRNAENFYDYVNKNNSGKFLCDGCLVRKKGGSAQCINCRVDYCEDCVQKYAKLIDNIEILTCDKKIYSSIFS